MQPKEAGQAYLGIPQREARASGPHSKAAQDTIERRRIGQRHPVGAFRSPACDRPADPDRLRRSDQVQSSLLRRAEGTLVRRALRRPNQRRVVRTRHEGAERVLHGTRAVQADENRQVRFPDLPLHADEASARRRIGRLGAYDCSKREASRHLDGQSFSVQRRKCRTDPSGIPYQGTSKELLNPIPKRWLWILFD